MNSDEKPTPPVPPSRHERVPELDERGSRILERDRQDTDCTQCGGPIYYVVRATGETMMRIWDIETFDPDEYRLGDTYERKERYHVCYSCGWRVDL